MYVTKHTTDIHNLIMGHVLCNTQMRSPTTYRMPPDIEKKVTELLKSKEFDKLADIYSVALRYWFDHKDRLSPKEEFIAWLKTDEAAALITDRIVDVRAQLDIKK